MNPLFGMEIEGIGEASTAALRLISEVPSYKITKQLETLGGEQDKIDFLKRLASDLYKKREEELKRRMKRKRNIGREE